MNKPRLKSKNPMGRGPQQGSGMNSLMLGVCGIFGAFCVAGSKFLAYSLSSEQFFGYWLIPTALAVIFLLVYFVSMRFFSGAFSEFTTKNVREKIGDNCYYLGFIYTLSSLMVTLVQIYWSGENRDFLINEIISGFGIALISTILGICLRVYLNGQIGGDEIEDLDAKAKADIAKLTNEFKSQLNGSMKIIQSLSGQLDKMLTQAITAYGKANDNSLQIIRENAEAASKVHLKALEEAVVRFSEELTKSIEKSILGSFDGLGDELSKALLEARDAVQRNMSNDIEFVKTMNENTEKLKAGSENLRKSLDIISSNLTHLTDTGVLNAAVSGLYDSVNKISETLEETSKVLTGATEKYTQDLEAASKSVSFGVKIAAWMGRRFRGRRGKIDEK